MKRFRVLVILLICIAAGYIAFRYFNRREFNPNVKYSLGQPLDSFNGVIVHYNGMVGHTEGRNLAADGYNIGMKYQCVEFVKRYYYQYLGHKMPDAYGNAKDFYDATLSDSSLNIKRALMQFCNGSVTRPTPDDLLIFDGHAGNPYGHVAIVCDVSDTSICIIQQNPGPFASSRETFALKHDNNKWSVAHSRLLGWLRMPK